MLHLFSTIAFPGWFIQEREDFEFPAKISFDNISKTIDCTILLYRVWNQGISCNYCFQALEILERSRLICSDVLFTLLCSSPARESFQNNPRWQHCCFSYYCLALSLSILLEGCRVLGLFDFAEIFGKNDKKR